MNETNQIDASLIIFEMGMRKMFFSIVVYYITITRMIDFESIVGI